MESGKIWFVTGASAGLGLALVKALLEQGHRVAATSRDVDALLEATGAALDGRRRRWPWILAMNAACGARSTWACRLRRPGRGGEQRRLPRGAAGSAVRRGAARGLRYRRLRRHERDTRRHAAPRARSVAGMCSMCRRSWLRWRGRGLGAYSAAVRAGRPDRGPGRRSRAAWRARHAGLPGRARVPQVARTLIQASQAQYAPRHLFLGRDAFDQARIKIQSVQQELALARDVDRHRSARRAPPGRVRRGEGDAGRQDGSIPDRLASGLARPRNGSRQPDPGKPGRSPAAPGSP